VAERLGDAGLVEAADMVREAAAELPDPVFTTITDILDDPNRNNIKDALTRLYRNDKISLEDMISCGVDADIIALVLSPVLHAAR
jgi:hypothetical protein